MTYLPNWIADIHTGPATSQNLLYQFNTSFSMHFAKWLGVQQLHAIQSLVFIQCIKRMFDHQAFHVIAKMSGIPTQRWSVACQRCAKHTPTLYGTNRIAVVYIQRRSQFTMRCRSGAYKFPVNNASDETIFIHQDIVPVSYEVQMIQRTFRRNSAGFQHA